MNKVFLVGNIVRDVETKIAGGYQVIQNTVAVKRNYPDRDGIYPTDFIDFQSWGKQAEYLEKYGAKGSKIAIVGRLQSREYDGRDGTRKTVWEVITDEIQLISSVQKPKAELKSEIKPQEFADEIDKEEKPSLDDLPF